MTFSLFIFKNFFLITYWVVSILPYLTTALTGKLSFKDAPNNFSLIQYNLEHKHKKNIKFV